MKFKLTCSECEHVMDLEGTIHVDRFQCEKCGSDIELRAGRMEEGVRIAGKYQTLYKTNDDGYSSSFICKDLNDDDLHLLRIYDKTLTKLISQPDEFMDIVSSVSFMAGANHMPIIDAGMSQEYMYQVMPFRKLESLEQLIEFGYMWDALQALDLIYELVLSLEEGVQKIGTGHFNLNPNNIFISNKGKVRYQGFGLAPQLLLEKSFINSDFQVFDIFYMSPELAKAEHYPNEASDVYSLAMVLYYMMTGLTPRAGKSDEVVNYEALQFPITVQQKLDNHFLALFAKMSAVDSQHRYQSIAELKKMIEAYFLSIGHESLAQMEGEKTDLYKQELYKQKVTNLLKPFAPVELKAIPSLNETVVRKRMATQTSIDIQLDLKDKVHNPKRVRRRRLKAHANPKRVQRERSLSQPSAQKSKSNGLLVLTTCLLIGIALSAVIVIAISKGGNDKPVLINTASDEVEIDLSVDEDVSQEINEDEDTPQSVSINKKFYEIQLRKAEIDFDLIDQTLASDRAKATLDKHKQVLDKYAKRIDLAKKGVQRRILIDLKSEAGSLIFNKKPNEAIALYLEYDGEFAEETSEQRKQLASEVELINKKLLVKEEHEEIKLENLKKVDLDENVELIAEYLLTDEYLLASVNSTKLLELDSSPGIKKFVNMIKEASPESLQNIILTNLAKADEGVIEVEFNKKFFKAKVISCDLDEGTVKLLINFATGQLSREYPLDNLSSKNLIKWIQSEDKSKEVFLRSMYSVHRGNLLEGARNFQAYEGLFKDALLGEFNKRLSIDANVIMEELFKSFNYPYLVKTPKVLSSDDLVAFEYILSSVLRKYEGLVEFNGGDQYYQGLKEKIKASISALQGPQVFIGLDESTTHHLQTMISKNKFTLRLLPGDYENDIKITGKKINIIGTKQVDINGNVTVSENDILLKNLNIHGDVIITQDVSNISIKNCVIEGAILLREDVNKLEVDNSIFYGIGGNAADKIRVTNSLIRKPKYALKAVINGEAEWEFVNCVISSNEELINFPQKAKRGEYSYCMLYTSKAIGNKKNESFYSLDEADGELGDFDKCLFTKPKFKDSKAGDYRLLEFSAGYQEGYKNESIGISMNEDLDLRRQDD